MIRLSTFESAEATTSKQIEELTAKKVVLIRETINLVKNTLFVQLNNNGADILQRALVAPHTEILIDEYFIRVSVMDTHFSEAYIMFPKAPLKKKQQAFLEKKIAENPDILLSGSEGRKLVINDMTKVPKEIKKIAGGES